MQEKWPVDDEGLLRAAREAVRDAASVPPRFTQAARATYAWRTLDSELAALAYDSALPTSSAPLTTCQPALREDVALLRYLTFVATDLTVEVEVGSAKLLGQVVPPGPGQLEVWTAGSTSGCTAIDALGCFCVSPVPARAFRLHVRTTGGARVLTAWIRLGDDAPAG